MPDWILFQDKDENRYYIDNNGKIWTSGKPDFDYKPVSANGLDYYLHQGIELIKMHHKTEGLTLLKSIIAMPADKGTVYDAQVKASEEINRLLRNEGNRFEELNKKASILLFKENKHITLVNDEMKYTIKFPEEISVDIASKRIRERIKYKYYGLLLGLKFMETKDSSPLNRNTENKKNKYYSYDILMAVDSEKFPNPVKTVKDIENHWRRRLGYDLLKRKIVNITKDKITYKFNDTDSDKYSGIEGFYKKGNTGYYLKLITSSALFKKRNKSIIEIINNFKIN
ncbi:MAG: hypothetical protein JW864_04470 [Spirochaetes bacterium]|nr:hypothetical protein [Spirochaetota bacterium]